MRPSGHLCSHAHLLFCCRNKMYCSDAVPSRPGKQGGGKLPPESCKKRNLLALRKYMYVPTEFCLFLSL